MDDAWTRTRPLPFGMLPLARELARRGCEVVLAANEVPAINDVTAGELAPLLPRVAAFDTAVAEAVAAGRLRWGFGVC